MKRRDFLKAGAVAAPASLLAAPAIAQGKIEWKLPTSFPAKAPGVGTNVTACPDTGNWSSNDVRYKGLALTFPLAVTCDFKARKLGAKGEHPLYDLKRCFEIGIQSGFRGPWCLEHANPNRRELFRELTLLRDWLKQWSSAHSD